MARRSVRILNDQIMVKMLTATLPGPLAVRYYRTLQHWLRHKGPEWTALRLKALWNIALLLRSGDFAQIPLVASEARIACADGLPKGVEGVLVRLWAHAQRPSRIRATAVALRAYTAIRLTNESVVQVDKSRRSINEPGVNDPDARSITSREYRAIKAGHFSEKEFVETLLPFGTRLHPRQPLQLDKLSKLSGTSSYPNLLKIPSRDIKSNPYLSMAASLCTKGKVPNSLIEKFGDFQMRKLAEQYQEESGDPTFGRITIIQEGGAKGRVVCSPNAWVQYYCYPYHRYLMNIVSAIETAYKTDPNLTFGVSCALDQVRGVYVALNHLNSGSFCHAVDLSSATDRFPLQLQKLTCEEIGIPEFASALEELKGPYWGLDNQMWYYGAGQPMGLYGSFPLFHLTHYGLLNGLSYRLGLSSDVPQFAVLGDDVLIFDEDLLRLYLNTLEKYEVPISWHKSYKGNLVEFAGFLITKSRNTWTAFRPYKYGNHGEMSSVLNVLHACGASTRRWSDYWAKAFDKYQKTAGLRQLDLSPLAPDDPDIRKDEGSPGLAWLGSLLTRCTYMPTERDIPLPDISEAWISDRYTLCQTKISSMDPFYYGETVPTDVVFDHNSFNPELYVQEDRAHKRSIYQMFWKDPVVKTIMPGGC